MSDTPSGRAPFRIGAAPQIPAPGPSGQAHGEAAKGSDGASRWNGSGGAPRAKAPEMRHAMAQASTEAPARSGAVRARAGVLATPGPHAPAPPRHGARRPAAAPQHGAPVDAQAVIARLEEAGRALLALPNTGYSTRMRLNAIEFVRSALTGEGSETVRADTSDRLRLAMPDAARISRMDEALAWIGLIPQDRYVLRRIVSCRALVSPSTERHLFPWRRIGLLIGADHKAVQRWHAQGIDIIVAALNAAR